MQPRLAALLFLTLLAPSVHAADDSLKAWDLRYLQNLDYAVERFVALAEWCDENNLHLSATIARREALGFRPDHPAIRAHFGYEKTVDGAWNWPNHRRLAFREKIDAKSKGAETVDRRRRIARKKIAEEFRKLGKIADFQEKKDPDRAAEWKRRAAMAWTGILSALPNDRRAHKLLDHPRFDGRYVCPEAVPWLTARKERRLQAEEAAKAGFEVTALPLPEAMGIDGFEGGGAKSGRVRVFSTLAPDPSTRITLWVRRGIAWLLAANDFPPETAEIQKRHIYYLLRTESELRRFLLRFSGWDQAKVDQQLELFSSVIMSDSAIASRKSSEERAIDVAMHYACRSAISAARRLAKREFEKPHAELEWWLRDALSTHVVRDLTGDSLSSFWTVPEYAHEDRDTRGLDRWMDLAKQRVLLDDDVPIRRLAGLPLNQLDAAAALKGYALLMYLYERDPVDAQEFVWMALVKGAVAAVEEIYGVAPEVLDAEYQEWIRLTW